MRRAADREGVRGQLAPNHGLAPGSSLRGLADRLDLADLGGAAVRVLRAMDAHVGVRSRRAPGPGWLTSASSRRCRCLRVACGLHSARAHGCAPACRRRVPWIHRHGPGARRRRHHGEHAREREVVGRQSTAVAAAARLARFDRVRHLPVALAAAGAVSLCVRARGATGNPRRIGDHHRGDRARLSHEDPARESCAQGLAQGRPSSACHRHGTRGGLGCCGVGPDRLDRDADVRSSAGPGRAGRGMPWPGGPGPER